jgi:hypothetical protein
VQKYCINNLRKYDLPNGWRLLYTIKGNEIEITDVITNLSDAELEFDLGWWFGT